MRSSERNDGARQAVLGTRLPKLCVHCSERPQSKARGLCSRCYSDPAVKSGYGPVKTNGGYAVQDFNGKSGLPEPTDTLPGTEERMRVLEERARLGQQLYHPNDRTHEEQDDE